MPAYNMVTNGSSDRSAVLSRPWDGRHPIVAVSTARPWVRPRTGGASPRRDSAPWRTYRLVLRPASRHHGRSPPAERLRQIKRVHDGQPAHLPPADIGNGRAARPSQLAERRVPRRQCGRGRGPQNHHGGIR
jgi:hypothetical protein